MTATKPQNSPLGVVQPDFAPFVPTINEIFQRIWTPHDIDKLRRSFQSSRSSIPGVPSHGFGITHRTIQVSDGSEVELRIYRPTGLVPGEEAQQLPLLFVAHGGGWVVGDHESEGPMSRLICVENKAVVISVLFRRAPEYQFPIPLNDVYDAYKWVVQHADMLGFDPQRIILGGSSAGANLIAALSLKLHEEGALTGVVGQLLNIPALCHPDFFPHDKHELRSYDQNADSPTVNGKRMRWFWDQYYPQPTGSMFASPLLASNFEGLPATLIQVAGMDPLRDEGLAYAEELRIAGVEVDVRIYAGVPHGFIFASELHYTKDYFGAMVSWTSKTLEN
ncbi:alpha/beta hydrolase fold-domain-containing protein [Aspergillus navahoensis]